jgi:hypothetical protein
MHNNHCHIFAIKYIIIIITIIIITTTTTTTTNASAASQTRHSQNISYLNIQSNPVPMSIQHTVNNFLISY